MQKQMTLSGNRSNYSKDTSVMQHFQVCFNDKDWPEVFNHQTEPELWNDIDLF